MRSWPIQVVAGVCTLIAACSLHAQCHEYERWAPQGDPIPTYGCSIAVSGEWAAIGANQDYSNNSGQPGTRFTAVGYKTGAVFMRKLIDGEWIDAQKIRCPNRNEFGADSFGEDVALHGRTLLIGSPGHELPNSHEGVVYIYEEVDGVWQLADQLTPFGGGSGRYFGSTVELDGEIAAIGASASDDRRGAVYIFERIDGVWTPIEKLVPTNAEIDDGWGSAISLQGTTLVCGARAAAGGQGAASVFDRVDGTWTEVARLRPSDPARGHNFGYAVCLNGEEALVGGQQHVKGRVYVFERRFGVWQEVESSSFTTSEGVQENHHFGRSIAIEGDVALIAATGARPGRGDGSAYLFYRLPDGWVEGPKIHPGVSENGDRFAQAMALAQGTAFIQSQFRSTSNEDAGEVHLTDISVCRLVLKVGATCPEGGPMTIFWMNATPGAAVALFLSPELGLMQIPPGLPCEGTTLNLDPKKMQLVLIAPSGTSGRRTLIGEASKGACGGFLQLLNIPTCMVSDPAPLR